LATFPSQLANGALQAATVHVDALQPAVPLTTKHCWLHPPQLFGSLLVCVSQPSTARWSQSWKPALHDATVHAPPAQPAVPFASLQTCPQVPQLFVSAPVSVSHPFAGLPSQSAKPGLHAATVHIPFVQPPMPFAMLHRTPQPPQLFGSFSVLISQPSALFPSQFAKPGLHAAMPQVPFVHAGVALAVTHGVPHAPQLLGLVLVLTSQPSAAEWSQSWKPALHEPMPQVPFVHPADALEGVLHTSPHEPQLLVLVLVSTSQPSAAEWSQSWKPALHAWIPHDPLVQLAVPLLVWHAPPHVPQLPVSVLPFTSHPFVGLPSQSR
jgi:hypothetical protein